MLELNKALERELQRHGLMAKTASIAHVSELKEEIAGLREKSMLDGQFYNENLHWLDFDYKNIMPDAKSILVIASPQLMTLLNFQYGDKIYRVPIPPTYVFSKVWETVEKLLLQVLSPYHYSIKKTALPAKLLAVRTGLGAYGKNNICYVSEKERDFPEWLDKSWHNSIVGCMKCQLACPKNRDFTGRAENEATFTSEETTMILERLPLDQLPVSLKQKLESFDMIEYYDVLHRNLSVLIG